MQTIEQYLIPNGYAGANVTSTGAASADVPYLVVGMPCQFIAHVVDASGAPATPAGLANVENWKFVLAGDFDPETAPCFTTDEIVWDAEECAWTVLLDGTRTASMLALLGDEPWVNIGCEVVGLGEDEDWAHPAYVLQWTARIRGRRDSDGLGVHPVTGERVANVLSADRGAELRVTDDGNLAITVPGASAPVVVTPAQIAAVAQNAITPEERAKWNDRERIVSANGGTELRARDGGSATLGVLDIHLGNAVATFLPGGGNFAVWTDEVSWQPKGAVNTVFEFVGPYPGVGVAPRNYWVPKNGDQFTNYDPTAATSGWHLSAPNGATTPEVLQYRDGPGFTISGWDTGAPTLEPLSGTNVRGTFWFTRPTVDSTPYKTVSTTDHAHEAVKAGDTELAAVNGGSAVIRRTQDAQKTCLASATLSWSYTGGGGQASGTVDLTIPADEHVSVAELAAGVETFRLHAKVWIVVNTGIADGVLTPNWFEGDCVATRDGATQGGGSHYALASENGKLNGGSIMVESDGVTFFSWLDDWHKDVPVEVGAATRTAQATRTDTVAVVTTTPVGKPETDKTLSVEDKPADGKAVGDALALKAAASHTHTSITAGDTTVSAVNGGTATISKSVLDWTGNVVYPDGYMLPSGMTASIVYDSETGIPSNINFFVGEEYVGGGSFTSYPPSQPGGMPYCATESIDGKPQYEFPQFALIEAQQATVTKTVATTDQIPSVPIKAVKRNGTALTPDANGAVNVVVPTTPSDIGAANQTALAAAFTAKAYAVGDLCTYNGLLHRCKSAYTATAQSYKPDSDTTHWEEAVVAVLLDGKVSKSGDVMTGGLTVPNFTVGSRATDTTVGTNSVAEGSGTEASGDYSHAEGDGTTAQNVGEHAQGQYNASHTGSTDAEKTIHSIGIGTDDNARTNAVEVMGDGKVFVKGVGNYDGTNPTGAQNPAADLATAHNAKLDATKRNLLDYTSGTTLALGTAVYRSSLNADGTFPAITDSGIPTAAAYYQFELELSVPSTVPSTITGPSGWDWLDGGEPPDPSVLSGGETIFVACRLDCATRAVTANVWRVA